MTDVKEREAAKVQAKISMLGIKINTAKEQIKRVNEFVRNQAATASIPALRTRLEGLERTYTNFEMLQGSLEELDPSVELERQRSEFEELYYELKPALQVFIQSAESRNVSDPPVERRHNVIKYPKITLPEFNGDCTRWMSFIETFNSLVHENAAFDHVTRFHYLRGALKDGALRIIESIEINSENYGIAYELLHNRYANKRVITQEHIHRLMSIAPITRPSPKALRDMIDDVNGHLRALTSLGRPASQWDDLIIYTISKKLDSNTLEKWEEDYPPNRMPTLQDFLKSLEKRAHTLEAKSNLRPASSQPKIKENIKLSKSSAPCSFKTTQRSSNYSCSYCSGQRHVISRCIKFLSLSPGERMTAVKRLNLCVNCLRPDHSATSCPSRHCQRCSERHHTLLHCQESPLVQRSHMSNADFTPRTYNSPASKNQQCSLEYSTLLCKNEVMAPYVLLATALIDVPDKCGTTITCRALLDSASQLHFISNHAAQLLGHKRLRTDIPITGIGATSITSSHKIKLTIKSRTESFAYNIEAHILPNISGRQPDRFINTQGWPIPPNITLADPSFFKPNSIDLLLGTELYAQIVEQSHIQLPDQLPSLQKTRLGWILMGAVPTNASHPHCNLATGPSLSALERQVQNFWEIERHDSPVKTFTNEEQACELHFQRNTKRSPSGQFIVRLPFRDEISKLGESRDMATRRFLALERRLIRQPELYEAYKEFMSEYESLGHMSLISSDKIPTPNYHLPHHCVQKLDSSTTKLRVVFDASARTTSGTSLNDALMVGPTIQSDLFSILTRFRTHRYVFTADCTKMYRQILVDQRDRHYQLILWRDKPTKPVQTYCLNTVTYGTAAASFLATRCLQELANQEAEEFPSASSILKHDFYVDDCMTGTDSLADAISLQAELLALLKRGNFELRKFCANHPSLLENIPKEHQEAYLNIHGNDVVKTLGLIWQPGDDTFQFNITPLSVATITKRTMLSDLAKIFDPLGLLGPVVILGKILLQQLWKIKLSWDDPIPDEFLQSWRQYREQLTQLNQLRIPRHLLLSSSAVTIQLHAFGDSSELAYGSCCYLRCIDSFGQIQSKLICAKSRVAPLKKLSLPRLELCAALLTAELVERIKPCLPMVSNSTYYYSDSTIVLAWLSSPSRNWTTFVANRVAKIQDLTDSKQWHHIASAHNPADLISRGTDPSVLCQSNLWYHGPEYLSMPESQWPTSLPSPAATIPEWKTSRAAFAVVAVSVDLTSNVNHHNSFDKLLRIFAFVRRFICNTRLPRELRETHSYFSVSELDCALLSIARTVQRSAFPEEYQALCVGRPVEKTSRLRSLTPFIDQSGLIRVGGRLRNTELSHDSKHQMILPSSHPLTTLYLSHLHYKHLHAGAQTLLAICRQRFWPLNGKDIARKVVNQCIRCFRMRPKGIEQLMGDLPPDRMTPARPFSTCGVDFCGPVKIHFKIRGKPPVKAYIAVFTCFTTKATHLELVGDLSTESFLLALNRFVSRRGMCNKIYSDNATNFVGAKSELKSLRNLFLSENFQNTVRNACLKDHIEWSMIPPKSPHFGGLWEAAVKSAKHHLVRTTATASLTYEEFNTILTQVEAILNSRPLTILSSDPNDPAPLTPGHFLIGAPLTSIPQPDITGISFTHLSRYQRVQQIQQTFWRRWSQEYLHLLQQRHKWSSQQRDIFVGMMVLVQDDNLPPLRWALGRIIKLFPGQDGLSRVADVKTQSGVFRRPITKLCPLPIDDNVEHA